MPDPICRCQGCGSMFDIRQRLDARDICPRCRLRVLFGTPTPPAASRRPQPQPAARRGRGQFVNVKITGASGNGISLYGVDADMDGVEISDCWRGIYADDSTIDAVDLRVE